jgi:hypothetical protein
MSAREPVELIEFLAPYPPEVQELALAARLRLLDLLGPISEIFYDAMSAVCSGFTFTGEVRDNFVNLAVYSDHVTLIFPHGAKLEDPLQRLKGTGTQVRHIRLVGLETLADPYVVDLIRKAEAMAPRPAEPVEPRTVVKVMKGPKRRPKPVA